MAPWPVRAAPVPRLRAPPRSWLRLGYPVVMDALLSATAAGLDHLRSRLLRATLRLPLLRRVFLDRALRLAVLFVLFELVALVLCTVVPVWQLLLGPLLYGYAHLLSSVRYVHHGLSDRPPHVALHRRWLPLAGLTGLYVAVRVLRLDPDHRLASEWAEAWLLDGAFLVMATGAAAWAARLRRDQLLLGGLVVVPLGLLLWSAPRLTIAGLALGHNAVGFLYWLRMARTERERRAALGCLVLFVALSGLVATGLLLPLRGLLGLDLSSGVGGVSLESLGRLLTPGGLLDPAAVVSAFALGQSTHYFVWLKALPDQVHDHAVPTSYRQSLRLLQQDFGPRLLRWLVGGVVGGLALWLVLGLEAGRSLYFAVAGFHGLLELAGLGLLRGPKRTPATARLG